MKDITTREEAWEACLALWRRLANTKSKPAGLSIKYATLEELGYYHYTRCGCPFCEVHYNSKLCPLGDCTNINPCYDTPYGDWVAGFFDENRHIQHRAKKFYKFLLKLKEEENAKQKETK